MFHGNTYLVIFSWLIFCLGRLMNRCSINEMSLKKQIKFIIINISQHLSWSVCLFLSLILQLIVQEVQIYNFSQLCDCVFRICLLTCCLLSLLIYFLSTLLWTMLSTLYDRKIILWKPVVNLIKHFTIVIYDSRVVLIRKLPILRP